MPADDDRSQRHALIVEDQPVMRALLHEFLQSMFPNCVVRDAHSGARAIELCTEREPELVLMDVCLPDANGVELTAWVRDRYPQTQVIVLSYAVDEATVKRAQAAGALACIAKDRLVVDLVPVVANALGVKG